ncbi:Regulatory protein AfsR [Streptomyces sp. ADI92-24]|uniref:AfsR/SARP family transcriptional regulator n=1 Tax=unclassified Streptomyces TaxID=2593676 RepID=UPI000F4AE0D8|nr:MULTISPECIES: AfsR/SARP family transcriptional regulator [unclassified Streptomyces]MCX4775196.1 AfsR/SARP family transcriptional regulator [Streptomyces sp. NBC_01285]ROQ65389.1 DNA-binding SARP family transcriptional activator [Streptomyces sp. CEV 2-1]RPK32951.1 Regulatory protein AfsR [Streptomyces sp. ADI92-24]
MELRILGPIELWTGHALADLGPARQRSILGVLLVDPERPLPLESLVDRVWGDRPPAGVRNVVHTYITRLRRALASDGLSEPVGLIRTPAGYQVSADPGAVDLVRFRRLLKRAQQEGLGDQERSTLLQQALHMWRGDALSGMQSDWAARLRETLRQLHHEALSQWADAEIRLERPGAVLAELRAALLTDPLSEQLCERLMLALYLEGRSVDALEYYQSIRRLIAKDLGTDPSRRLQRLYETILRGETAVPALSPDRGDIRGAGPQSPGTPAAAVFPVTTAPHIPQMLPIDLPDFIGRERELDVLQRTLTQPTDAQPPAVVLVGGGGVGKTALAVRLGHRLRSAFPDGQLYAALRGSTGRPADPHAVQGRLLRALGTDPDRLPADPDERAEVYRLALAGRHLLLTLDDAADDEQVQPLLPGSADTAVLITSRGRLSAPLGARVPHLAELPNGHSVRLLARLLGPERVSREPSAAAAIARYCGGLPLALRAAAVRLNTRPHWSLSRYAERLSDDGRRLDELAHGSLSVRASFRATYNALPKDAREALCCLGHLPMSEFDAHLACPVLGKDFATVEDACEQLVEAYFLSVAAPATADQPTRYRLDGLQRSFAQELGSGQEAAATPALDEAVPLSI